MKLKTVSLAIVILMVFSSCGTVTPGSVTGSSMQGIATLSFLADIAGAISGERISFSSLIPPGTDPHVFEAVPSDIVILSRSIILVQNGAGLEAWLVPLLKNASGQRLVVNASAGLESRNSSQGEADLDNLSGGLDPHFWLDPNLVITYVKNIRDGLIEVDPSGESAYKTLADEYITELESLDGWIKSRVAEIPAEDRLLVTNHETLGYFADRYGFTVIGTIIPGTSSGVTPGARELAELEDKIRATGVEAIFVEIESNNDLAEQIGRDTGVKVVTGLYTHSLSDANGPAPTYLQMMKHNVNLIVDSLTRKQ
jgi:ABC-type Zn uptake system ZnuABC Zn-binding protein ZnuA